MYSLKKRAILDELNNWFAAIALRLSVSRPRPGPRRPPLNAQPRKKTILPGNEKKKQRRARAAGGGGGFVAHDRWTLLLLTALGAMHIHAADTLQHEILPTTQQQLHGQKKPFANKRGGAGGWLVGSRHR